MHPLIPAFLTFTLAMSQRPSDVISGQYVNQLGSNVTIKCFPDTGVLSGSYQTAVGNAGGQYPLIGLATSCADQPVLGFCVAWNNAVHGNTGSTTCWSGQYLANDDSLSTTWLLASQPNAQGQVWSSNRVGADLFQKQQR